jgi:hypothetical protein
MASYKDQNITFSPYVQTIPVEEMAKVGMFKQERYDQGVQKIQQNIDNIAGLDIVRPEDKKYLESKLNALGSQLSTVAGGDFSNFQLVNSVNGMTNQIVKDPRVMRDVASSSAYRKALETQEKVKGEGKGSASNDFIFNEQVNAWMNGGEDAKFNSTYRPYSDYETKKRDIVKSLTAQVTGKSIVYGSDGRLLDAMTYEEVEEIPAQKILTALKQGLSPDEFQQLQIDGRYKYANVPKEQFVSDVNSRFTEAYDRLATQKKNLYTGMQMLDDPIKQELVQNEMNRLSNEMTNVKQQYETTSESFLKGDVESAKARLFTNDWFNDSANVYAVKNVTQEYKTNPALAVQLQREGWARADARTQATLDQAAAFKREDNKIEILKIQAANDKLTEKQRLAAEKQLENIYITKSKTRKDEVATDIIGQIQQETTALITNGGSIKGSILDMTANDIGDYDTDKDGKLSDREKEVKFDRMLEMYTEQSTNLTAPIKERITKYLENQEMLDLKNRQVQVASDYATTTNPVSDYVEEELKILRAERPDENLVLGSNYYKGKYDEIWEYSQKEMLEKFVEFKNSKVKSVNKYHVNYPEKWTPNQREEVSRMTNGMDPRLLELWKFSRSEGIDQSSKARSIRRSVRSSSSKISEKVQERADAYNKDFANKLKETSTINQGVDIGINSEDSKAKENMKSRLNQMVVGLNVGDSGISGSNSSGEEYTSLSMKDITTFIQSAESGFVTRNSDGTSSVTFTTETGETVKLPVSDDSLTNLFPLQAGQSSPQVRQFDNQILPQMLLNDKEVTMTNVVRKDEDGNETIEVVPTQAPNNYWTTSTDGNYNTNPENSYFKQYKFQNVKNFEVTGNIVSSVDPKLAGNNKVFTLKLNVIDPRTKKQVLLDVDFGTLYSKGNILKTISQLSDEAIIGYLAQNKANEKAAQEKSDMINAYLYPTENNSKQ